jgi:para-nitrobenzyl esterase
LDEPGRCLAQGVGSIIPYLTGANSFDGSVMPSYQLNLEDYAAVWDEWDPSWRTVYGADLVTAPETGIQRLFGDERYLLSAWVLSEAMARLGAPAYRYYLDVQGPEGLPLNGSPHGFDGFLLFESKVVSPGSDWDAWGDQLRCAWIEFARSGVPCALDARVEPWQPVGESSQWHRLGSASSISDQALSKRLARLLSRYHHRCHEDSSQHRTS